MATTKAKGDLAELMVAADLRRKGCRSHSLTNGKVRQTKKYTASMIDWLAVYDRVTDRCYYVPAAELGEGRSLMHLRLTAALNGQRDSINFAHDYLDLHAPTQQRLGY